MIKTITLSEVMVKICCLLADVLENEYIDKFSSVVVNNEVLLNRWRYNKETKDKLRNIDTFIFIK